MYDSIMKSILFRFVLRFLGLFGYEVVKQTAREDLLAVLKSQLPLDAGIELLRLGDENDGGYLIPNDIIGISKCVSPGCDKKIAFETDLLTRFGISSVIIDKADAKPRGLDDSHTYIEKWLGLRDSDSLISLNTLLKSHQNGDLLLQMDIEGAEYEILLGTSSEDLERFRIILIEFHYLSNMKNRMFFDYIGKTVFQKLSQTHTLVHAHPNNCAPSWSHQGIQYPEVMEYTYLRKDRIATTSPYSVFRHVLDAPNVVGNPEPIIHLQ